MIHVKKLWRCQFISILLLTACSYAAIKVCHLKPHGRKKKQGSAAAFVCNPIWKKKCGSRISWQFAKFYSWTRWTTYLLSRLLCARRKNGSVPLLQRSNWPCECIFVKSDQSALTDCGKCLYSPHYYNVVSSTCDFFFTYEILLWKGLKRIYLFFLQKFPVCV